MNKSTIIKDIQDVLEHEYRSSVKYIDKDWGQLSMENPPVGWPCILIDIEEVSMRDFQDGNQQATAIVVVTVANRRTNSSSAHAPAQTKDKSYITLDLTDSVHDTLRGFCADNSDYTPLETVSFYKNGDFMGGECYVMRYRTKYNI